MLPRSSMATSRFTSTFFAARAFEPGGQADGHDGRHHLGGDAHGDGQGEQQRVDQRPGQRHVDDEDERGQHGRHREQEAREARQARLEGGLAVLLGQARGDLPERRAGPGPHHHARAADPWCTIVPMNAHPGWSCGSLPAAAAGRLGHRHRLAGQHALVALQLVGRQQAQVSRDERADAQRHHVAGHQVRDRDPAPPARPCGPRPPAGSGRAARPSPRSARYSLKNPRPTLRATITAMISAFVPPPVRPDTSAAPSSRIRIGLRTWRQHGQRPRGPGACPARSGRTAAGAAPPRRPTGRPGRCPAGTPLPAAVGPPPAPGSARARQLRHVTPRARSG